MEFYVAILLHKEETGVSYIHITVKNYVKVSLLRQCFPLRVFSAMMKLMTGS